MQRKSFKPLTALLLILTLFSPNAVYAEDPSSSEANASETYEVYADMLTEEGEKYAVDIFQDKKMIFHYKTYAIYDPDSLSLSGVTTGKLTEEQAKTCAHDYDPDKEGGVEDSDGNPSGSWFGFDGVVNRIAVFNRSNADIKMTVNSQCDTAGYDNMALNLFLNGDGTGDYTGRRLDVTKGKDLKEGSKTIEAMPLYDHSSEPKAYTAYMSDFLSYTQAFVPDGSADTGGRFAAISANDSKVTPVTQDGKDNVVKIASHLYDAGGSHKLGYAVVYFDISGEPTDPGGIQPYSEENTVSNATPIGSITLTFSSVS